MLIFSKRYSSLLKVSFGQMMELTPELHAKFLIFRESFESALMWLADAPGNTELKERSASETAQRAANASEIEAQLFLKLMKNEIPKPS